MAKKKIKLLVKLLVLDDERDICNFIKLWLRKKGFAVYSTLTGRGALKLAKKVKPQIALLDIHLKKDMDGLEALRRIRKIIPTCRNVMITWDKTQEKVKIAKRLGAVSYLTKPLTTNQLYKVINRIAKKIRKRGKSHG
jgi:DNA-binding response OmpR family regulator